MSTDTADQARAELEALRLREQLRTERDAAKRDRRDARRADRRKRRDEAWARHRERVSKVGGAAKDLAPQLIVNAGAVYGQVAWVVSDVAPADWATPAKLALGALLAGAAESIAVTVGWYAHDALMDGATATAARLRRGSYLIACVIGAVNYAHFADPDDWMKPTPLAVVLAVCSIMSPILWGLYSRRAKRVHLRAEGAADCVGAVFSAERFRAFPIRTIGARRWSIEHNVADPVEAWDGYNADRSDRLRALPRGRVRGAWSILSGTPIESRSDRVGPGGSDRPAIESGRVGSAGVVDPVPALDRPAEPSATVGATSIGSGGQSAGAQPRVAATGAKAPRRTAAKVPKPERVVEAYRLTVAAIRDEKLPAKPSAERIRTTINKGPDVCKLVRDHLEDGTTPEGLRTPNQAAGTHRRAGRDQLGSTENPQ